MEPSFKDFDPRGANKFLQYPSEEGSKRKMVELLGLKGLGSIRGVFGPISKISFTLSNYSFVIWDKNYRRYFVI